jgi:dihydroorotase
MTFARVGERLSVLELSDATVVDPASGRVGRARIVVRDGRFESVSVQRSGSEGRTQARTARGQESPLAGELLVLPGLVDLHAHFREPGSDAETIASGAAAAAHGGFTRVALMPNTEPPADSAHAIERTAKAAGASGSPVRIDSYGTITRSRAGASLAPLGELADAGAIGFSDDGAPVEDAGLLRNALAYAGALGRPIIEHSEEPRLSRGSEAHDGLAATILGLRGAPAAAEVAAVARDLAILADAVADAPRGAEPRLHLTHLSCARSIDLVRDAKAAGLPVTCDVTPHHLAFHDGWLGGDRRFAWEVNGSAWAGGPSEGEPYDPSTRVNPPLRSPEDAAALARGLRDGTVDAIATDHAPHGVVDKEVEFGDASPGISGIETALSLVLAAVDAGALDLLSVGRALTVTPATILDGPARRDERAAAGTGQRNGPAFAVGALADFVVVDRAAEWDVSDASLLSRGKNTPLLGRRLPGRVLLTVAGGRVAYVDPDLG